MTLIDVIKLIALMSAALLIGNWFLTEVKKARAVQAPWYRPYLTPPGIMVIIALLLPIVVKLIK